MFTLETKNTHSASESSEFGENWTHYCVTEVTPKNHHSRSVVLKLERESGVLEGL